MARPSLLRRLARNERGVALVEFAIVLPVLLLLFAVIIEGGRLMWSYQTAIAGVRDATRYLGRVVSSNACQTGQTFPDLNSELLEIVRESITGASVIPSGVTVNSVTSSLNCEEQGTTIDGTFVRYRVSPAPVAIVSASVTITFPFSGIFGLVGQELETVTTTVTDRTRVFGA